MTARHAGLALVLAASLVTALSLATAHAQPSVDAIAADSIFQQLDAFRRNDYDAAYTFASAEIHTLFDRRSFEAMVRNGYPEIADSVRAHVADAHVGGDGHAYIRLKIRGANGKPIEALYDMVREGGAWRVNGVVARPDPGEEA